MVMSQRLIDTCPRLRDCLTACLLDISPFQTLCPAKHQHQQETRSIVGMQQYHSVSALIPILST